MAEWWNLDQVLIWMLKRDLELVALAEGDAQGNKSREAYYFDFAPSGEENETDELQCGGTMTGLVDLLDKGRIISRDDLNETSPYPFDISFINYHCVLANDGPHLALRSAAYPYRWQYIRVDADSVRAIFPQKVSAEMQEELARLLNAPSAATLPEARPPVKERLHKANRVKDWLDKNQPDGLPDPDLVPGGRVKLYYRIIEDLTAQFQVPFSRSTVEKAALEWAENPSGKTEKQN